MLNLVRWLAAVVVLCAIAFGVMFTWLEHLNNDTGERIGQTAVNEQEATAAPATATPQNATASSDQPVAVRNSTSATADGGAPAITIRRNPDRAGSSDDSAQSGVGSGGPEPGQTDVDVADRPQDAAVSDASIARDGSRQDDDTSPAPDADEDESDDEPTLPEGSEILSGRILASTGEPLDGAFAEIRYRDPETRRVAPGLRRAPTDAKGIFRFEGLAQGEYQLKNSPFDGYANQVRYVRAGSRSADLVLENLSMVSIEGRVTDTEQQGLSQVTVILPGQGSRPVITDDAGRYVASVELHQNLAIAIRYELKGYRPQTRMLNGREIDETKMATIDVEMPAAGNIVLEGRVLNELGEAVEGETVRLFSPALQQTYQGRSDRDGVFSIDGIVAGDDYRVNVLPQQGYLRYESGIMAIGPGIAPLEITLKTEETGEVIGSIVDVSGQPQPGFAMTLVSARSPTRSKSVIADETGRFSVQSVPAGDLYFSTASEPRIEMRGISLEPGANIEVTITVDIGRFAVSGVVLSAEGNPVPGARVSMTARIPGVLASTTSHRQTRADDSGAFVMTGVGEGPHRINASSQGQGFYQLEIVVNDSTQPVVLTLKRDGG